MAIAVLQELSTTPIFGDAVTSLAITFGSNVAAGSLCVITIGRYSDTPQDSFVVGDLTKTSGTSTIGTIALDQTYDDSNLNVAVYSFLVTGAGSLTLTLDMTGSTNQYSSVCYGEYSGSWDSTRKESSTNGAGNTSTTITTGNVTTAGGALLVAAASRIGGGVISITPGGSGWTQLVENEDDDTHQSFNSLRKIVTSGTTEAATWTFGTATDSRAVIAAYKEVAGGSPADESINEVDTSFSYRAPFALDALYAQPPQTQNTLAGAGAAGPIPSSMLTGCEANHLCAWIGRRYDYTIAYSDALPEAPAGGTSYAGDITDSLAITDSLSGVELAAGSLTDSLTITDSLSGVEVAAGTLTDSVAVTDTLSGVGVAVGEITDSLAITDSLSGTISGAPATYAGDISDSLAITDSLSGVEIAAGTLTDSLTITDTLSGVELSAGTLTDSLAITDSLSGVEVSVGDITDSVTITDTLSGVEIAAGTFTDSVAITDSLSGVIVPAGSLPGDITDSLVISDTVSGGAVFNCTITDSFAISDTLSGTGGSDVSAAPAPSGVPGGRRRPRIAVRINGRMYVGSYDEISDLVAQLGAQDARAEVSPEPITNRAAKQRARKAAGKFDKSMQVIDIGLPEPIDLPIDPAPIAQRDLREEYLRAYAAAMLVAYQQAAQQAHQLAMRRAEEAEEDDLEAIEAVLELM